MATGMHGYVNNNYVQGMHNSTNGYDREMDLAEREQWAKWKEAEEARKAEERKQQYKYNTVANMSRNMPKFDFGGSQEVPDVNLFDNGGNKIGGSWAAMKKSLLG
jgi:hypothetical protein